MIACTRCHGHGSTCNHEHCNDHACSHCHGHGAELCFDCRDEATRCSLSDRSIHLCSSCAVIDDMALVEYLATIGVTGQLATAWMCTLPLMSDAEVRRLAGVSDEEYRAEIEARCGRSAA